MYLHDPLQVWHAPFFRKNITYSSNIRKSAKAMIRNEDFDSIVSDITSKMSTTKYEIIKDREEAIRYAFKTALPGDIIALIGKGHEKYKIINNSYIQFDERRIVEDILKETDEAYANKA